MLKINSFCVAVVLGVFATVVSGCITSSKSCKIPHAGDGGVLDKKGCYINDSILVWVDVAKNCFSFVFDSKGCDALYSWIDASRNFNIDEEESMKRLHQANDSFKNVAPFIRKSDLKTYFMKVNGELGALLKAKNMKDINDYMVAAYPQFKKNLGC